MKYDMILKELNEIDLPLVQFSSPFCNYLALKLRWSGRSQVFFNVGGYSLHVAISWHLENLKVEADKSK